MLIIIGEKGSGRTELLVRMCSEHKYVMLCRSLEYVKQINRIADKLNVIIPQPITYDMLAKNSYKGRHIEGVVLDNVEDFLSFHSNGLIKVISLLKGPDIEIKELPRLFPTQEYQKPKDKLNTFSWRWAINKLMFWR